MFSLVVLFSENVCYVRLVLLYSLYVFNDTSVIYIYMIKYILEYICVRIVCIQRVLYMYM